MEEVEIFFKLLIWEAMQGFPFTIILVFLLKHEKNNERTEPTVVFNSWQHTLRVEDIYWLSLNLFGCTNTANSIPFFNWLFLSSLERIMSLWLWWRSLQTAVISKVHFVKLTIPFLSFYAFSCVSFGKNLFLTVSFNLWLDSVDQNVQIASTYMVIASGPSCFENWYRYLFFEDGINEMAAMQDVLLWISFLNHEVIFYERFPLFCTCLYVSTLVSVDVHACLFIIRAKGVCAAVGPGSALEETAFGSCSLPDRWPTHHTMCTPM